MERKSLDLEGLRSLLRSLIEGERELVAPVMGRGVAKVRHNADIDAAIETLLHARDEQRPGSYFAWMEGGDGSLAKSDDGADRGSGRANSGHAGVPVLTRASSESWRRFLVPADETVWDAQVDPSGAADPAGVYVSSGENATGHVFFGMRGCDVAGIDVQDRVWGVAPYADPGYVDRRARLFVFAVDCSAAAGDNTCFCASMGTGPHVQKGFDLALTVLSPDSYVVRSGSPAGAEALSSTAAAEPSIEQLRAVRDIETAARSQLGRSLPMEGLKERLYAAMDSPEWDSPASRCFSCSNCTLICPTCFCNRMVDQTGLHEGEMSRERMWDSCFSLDHSYIHGGHMRESIAARYRQWLTHKIATWQDQFGVPGCTGCGRCLTWCPAGIDITEEAKRVTQEA